MLKRYQVLLDDWLAGHINTMCERYDTSFSEQLRIALCRKYLDLIPLMYPQYKNYVDLEDEKRIVKKGNYEDIGREGLHMRLSKMYFETQKAIEFANAQEAKKSKKQKKGGE